MLVQAFPHSVWFAGHEQLPDAQTSTAAHALPQAPQFAGSIPSLTQRLPQSAWALGHMVVQAPETHASPVAHALPHPPQLAGSVWVVEHTEPHSFCPVGQLEPHMSLAQMPAHVTPHPPQLALSVCVFTHAFPASPPQSAWPIGHTQ